MKKFLLIAMMLIPVVAFSQSHKSISGTVKDAKGEPVVGAVLSIEGNTSGAMTDVSGNYTLNYTPASGKKTIMVVSCLGYAEQKIELVSQTKLDIILEEESELLEDAVVVGYGSMRRSDLTGSVTSIKIDDTEAGQSSNLSQLLQGRAAGV